MHKNHRNKHIFTTPSHTLKALCHYFTRNSITISELQKYTFFINQYSQQQAYLDI